MMKNTNNIDKCNKYWVNIVNLLGKAYTDKMYFQLLELILTIDEKKSLITRMLIIQALLTSNIKQRELKKKLKIGIATITRGSNSLKKASTKFKYWLTNNLLNNPI